MANTAQFSNLLLQQRLTQAHSLFQAGKHDEAWLAIDPIRSSLSNLPKAQILIGLIAAARGQFGIALQAHELALKLSPHDPEVVNLHANALVNDGKPEEALRRLDRMAATFPKAIDGHVNRSIVANDLGQYETAIAAAQDGLRHFAGNSRLLALKAMAQKNDGQLDEAVTTFRLALQSEPDRALTRHNYASTLMAAGHYLAASQEFESAVRLGKNDDSSFCGWAASELENGEIAKAIALYEHVLSAVPAHNEASRALTRIRTEYDVGGDAFGHYAQAARRFPNEEAAWLRWIDALLNYKKLSEIAAVVEEASSHCADFTRGHAIASFAAGISGDHLDAEREFERLTKLTDRLSTTSSFDLFLIQLALKARRGQQAAELAERVLRAYPHDQAALCYLATAWRLLGDEREFWLCDYDNFISLCDVPCADMGMDGAAFAAHFAVVLDGLHRTKFTPGNQSLRDGTQTSGALFARHNRDVRIFRDALKPVIEGYLSGLPSGLPHPFLDRRTGRFAYSGSWSVRLAANGFHERHFHSEGWISSAYYARLPGSIGTAAGSDNFQGALAFGAPPEILGLDLEPRRIIIPQAGKLALFPSYMWHGTLPFTGDETRLTAAFDVVPD